MQTTLTPRRYLHPDTEIEITRQVLATGARSTYVTTVELALNPMPVGTPTAFDAEDGAVTVSARVVRDKDIVLNEGRAYSRVVCENERHCYIPYDAW